MFEPLWNKQRESQKNFFAIFSIFDIYKTLKPSKEG